MGNICCAPQSDTTEEPDTSPPLTLDQVLTIFLLCFEAAINALPFYPPILSTTRLVPQSSIPWLPPEMKVWEFTYDYSTARIVSPNDLEDLPAWFLQVHRALRKKDLCDHFCLLLDRALRLKLEELHLGTSRWARFPPLARALYAEIVPDQPSPTSHLEELNICPPVHSVFEITITSGEKLIFDGTPEQFGWSDSAWTMDKEEIEKYYVEGRAGFEYFWDEQKMVLKELILERDNGLWKSLFGKMEELLEELDWESLKRLQTEALWMRVTEQAHRKFNGVGDR